jgi:hypothetical protein
VTGGWSEVLRKLYFDQILGSNKAGWMGGAYGVHREMISAFKFFV